MAVPAAQCGGVRGVVGGSGCSCAAEKGGGGSGVWWGGLRSGERLFQCLQHPAILGRGWVGAPALQVLGGGWGWTLTFWVSK